MLEVLHKHPIFKRYFEFAEQYERHIGVGALLLGFVIDTLTLGRPDQLFGNVILTSYLLLSAGAILFLALSERRGADVPPILSLVLMQFSFGNLAGGLLVLYGQSGTFEGSYLFFLVFGAFVLANEFLRKRYAKLNFNISAWFFLLLAYMAIVVPVLFKHIGAFVFLLSNLLSFGLALLFLFFLYKVSSKSFAGMKRKLSLYLGAILLLFGSLYFLNILPPVPLSLQGIGIYHSIVSTPSGDYSAKYEKPNWYELFRSTDKIFSLNQGAHAFCFSSVFAPAGLSTPIFHRWEYMEEGTNDWQTVTLLSFPIQGGRNSGYRLYSEKSGLIAGKWRCSVETERGALIGRTTFSVVEKSVPNLATREL